MSGYMVMDRTNENLYATKFMILKPENMGFFQLFQVLFGSDLHKKDFVQTLEFIFEERLSHKWFVFASLLIQKFLHWVACPLKCIGDIVELCLNPEASNKYNIFMLLSNILRGKKLVNKDSAEYVSIIGHLDRRVELDNSIKREDSKIKYNAALSIMASKVSYENKAVVQAIVVDHWKMELVDCCRDYWNDYQKKATTQGFILLDKGEDHNTYVVAFRGTEPFDSDAWSTNFDFSWLELPDFGKTHAGFMKALGLQLQKNVVGWPRELKTDERPPRAYYTIRDLLKKRLDANKKAKFIVTGHSQGGALAILFAAVLMLHEETLLLERLEGVYTFGQPRVGDKIFADYMKQKLKDHGIEYYRFVYYNDIVPRLPFDDKIMKFEHFGTCLYFDRNYKGQKLQEEPNKNFFSWKDQIPMRVNAFWELVRSFTIASKYGPEYQEGWLLRSFRLSALAFPGFSDHFPQDYVNVTRLGHLSHLD